MPQPSLLLINPWIYDFAAYDYFARPLGLLYLAGMLAARGYEVHLLDCLGVRHTRSGPFGTGRFPKEILPTPAPLAGITRHYGRYGISRDDFREQLSRIPQPEAVLVTSLMTYWYPGVTAAIALVRERFPQAPVILGGIYATLCPEHARQHSGADLVITGPGEDPLLARLAALPGGLPEGAAPSEPCLQDPRWRSGPGPGRDDFPPESRPYPALHLLPYLTHIPLLTSWGCPFHCDYCASHLLQRAYRRRHPLAVVAELQHWQETLGLSEVAFYDDALLLRADDHLLVILEELMRRGLEFRFHTPNAMHARLVTPQVAQWLRRAGFATLRLGAETTALGAARHDGKLAAGELEAALAYLLEAGFRRPELGVYLLLGLPGQAEEEVETSIRRVRELGATPILVQYSPIPGTALWSQAVQCSRYDLEAEPLYHNNSLFPCWPEFSWERYSRLKR